LTEKSVELYITVRLRSRRHGGDIPESGSFDPPSHIPRYSHSDSAQWAAVSHGIDSWPTRAGQSSHEMSLKQGFQRTLPVPENIFCVWCLSRAHLCGFQSESSHQKFIAKNVAHLTFLPSTVLYLPVSSAAHTTSHFQMQHRSAGCS
jgi:hypothetical protein